MDLTQASHAHAEWKVKLRLAISKKEQLDVRAISADDQCALGKWLHGEARQQMGKLKTYGECVHRHAAFHQQAGAVAAAINAADYTKAEKMLDSGTPYAAASSAVGSAILGLKKEAAL